MVGIETPFWRRFLILGHIDINSKALDEEAYDAA